MGFENVNKGPLDIFGMNVPRKDVQKTLVPEFWYYNNIYNRMKLFGLPLGSWVDHPEWVLELFEIMKEVDDECENYSMGN